MGASSRRTPRMRGCGISWTVALVLGAFPLSARAQESGRIWGRVETVSGRAYEGYIRWDRNEGSWVDLLNGDKAISLDSVDFRIWNERADSSEAPPDRVIEFGGVRITWPDFLADFPTRVSSGIRFGHLERLVPLDEDSVRLVLQSGEVVGLRGGSTDLGTDVREILVDVPGGDVVELGWEDLAAVEFRAPPPGARPRGERIHGTLTDGSGNEYTGFLAWDKEKILTTDTLVGKEGLRERRLPFAMIAAVEKTPEGARVSLRGGESLSLRGSDDVTSGNDGIEISDPALGTVEVEWRDFQSVRFWQPRREAGYGDFDGGHSLQGTVVTLSGKRFEGRIRFDADETWSWEILDGIRDHETFDIEFGNVVLIQPLRPADETHSPRNSVPSASEKWRGARVSLADGRVLELDGSNDVDEGNKGVMVRAEGQDAGPWLLVPWKDVLELRLRGRE